MFFTFKLWNMMTQNKRRRVRSDMMWSYVGLYKEFLHLYIFIHKCKNYLHRHSELLLKGENESELFLAFSEESVHKKI